MAIFFGSEGPDVFIGGDDSDEAVGFGGDDLLRGGGSYDGLQGMEGDDRLFGEEGNDILEGGPGADLVDGGPGSDEARYNYSDAPVTIDLARGFASGGEAEGDVLVDIESVWGSPGSDILIGDEADNVLDDGDNRFGDVVGDDVLIGGGGDDIFVVGPGDDIMLGGAGTDTVRYTDFGVEETTYVNLATGDGREGDTLHGIENVEGSARDDTIIGDDADNVLDGRSGADVLDGGGGRDRLIGGDYDYGDTLKGGDGHDVLYGGEGADTLAGGGGNDRLAGGDGADRFVMNAEAGSRDRIVDFQSGEDGDALHITPALQARAGIASFEDLMSKASETADGVYVDFSDGDPWTFGVLPQDVALGELTPDNVAFDMA